VEKVKGKHNIQKNNLLCAMMVNDIVSSEKEPTMGKRDFISAGDLLVKINNGENINIKEATILGNLDIDELVLARDEDDYVRIASSSIKIINSVIEGYVKFERAVFAKSVVFSGSTIKGNVSFEFSIFERIADFSSVSFNSNATFWQVQFKDRSGFSPTHVKGPKFLKSAEFKGNATFGFAKFFDVAEFSEAVNNKKSEFSGAEFYKDADFCETIFSECADFYSAKFKGDLIFWGAQFEFIQMEWGTEISRFHTNWNDVRKSLYCDYGPTYLSIIKGFKELERFDDADDCYYDYRKWSQNIKSMGWSKFVDYCAWASCGYGVRPSHAICFGISLIFLFGMLLQLSAIFDPLYIQSIVSRNNSETYIHSAIVLAQGIDYASILSSLELSLKVFITGDLTDISGIKRYIAMAELFIRGLLFALFVVVLTKKLIR
jgi:uncharacterized protein YjbI with pentapeptide repeats